MELITWLQSRIMVLKGMRIRLNRYVSPLVSFTYMLLLWESFPSWCFLKYFFFLVNSLLQSDYGILRVFSVKNKSESSQSLNFIKYFISESANFQTLRCPTCWKDNMFCSDPLIGLVFTVCYCDSFHSWNHM